MNLKQKVTTYLSSLLFCLTIVVNVSGQVKFEAHVTAEVVETVHTSSTITTIFPEKIDIDFNVNLHQGESSWTSEPFSLGALTINAVKNMAFSINVENATLADNKGNSFIISPFIGTSGISATLRADARPISLSGTAQLTHGLAAGRYQGTYNLVVLYN